MDTHCSMGSPSSSLNYNTLHSFLFSITVQAQLKSYCGGFWEATGNTGKTKVGEALLVQRNYSWKYFTLSFSVLSHALDT